MHEKMTLYFAFKIIWLNALKVICLPYNDVFLLRVQLRNKKFSWKDAKRQQNQEKKLQSKIREGGIDTGPDPLGNPSQSVSLTAPAKPAW